MLGEAIDEAGLADVGIGEGGGFAVEVAHGAEAEDAGGEHGDQDEGEAGEQGDEEAAFDEAEAGLERCSGVERKRHRMNAERVPDAEGRREPCRRFAAGLP